MRLYILSLNPRCQAPGCSMASSEVDHIASKARGGSDDLSNLQALCKRCHVVKTNREDGGRGYG